MKTTLFSTILLPIAAFSTIPGCDTPSDGNVIQVLQDAPEITIQATIEDGSLELYAGDARFTHPNDSVVNEVSGDGPVTLTLERGADWDGSYALQAYTVTETGDVEAWDGDQIDVSDSLRFFVVASDGNPDSVMMRDPIVAIRRIRY